MTSDYDPNFPKNLDIHPSQALAAVGHIDHEEFSVAAQEDAIRDFGIAGRVWEAAYLFAAYIRPPQHLLFDPPFVTDDELSQSLTILELGSGTGIVSAVCAERLSRGRHTIVATDLPEVCPLLERNLHKSGIAELLPSTPAILVRPLTWGNELEARAIAAELGRDRSFPQSAGRTGGVLTHVLCSDLVYFPELLAPLLRTLIQVTDRRFEPSTCHVDSPRVIISYKIRSLSKETGFWNAFGLWFSFHPVLVQSRLPDRHHRDLHDDEADATQCLESVAVPQMWTQYGSDDGNDQYIFVASRRPESFAWRAPAEDDDLLAGVGAWGTSARKSDDTFEGLLLMGLDTDIQ